MKTAEITEINIALNKFPDNLARLIKELLNDKNYPKKHDARITLVNMGPTIIPQMHKLLGSPNRLLRIEAAKIVELIADRKSIPSLIGLLDDKEFDIRWIAGEGLIKIGRRSILPLLKSVLDGKSSHFYNESAHHVLLGLLNNTEKKKLGPLLLSLENYHELGETAPVEASKALTDVFECKT
jgi:HEAT repeat protein